MVVEDLDRWWDGCQWKLSSSLVVKVYIFLVFTEIDMKFAPSFCENEVDLLPWTVENFNWTLAQLTCFPVEQLLFCNVFPGKNTGRFVFYLMMSDLALKNGDMKLNLSIFFSLYRSSLKNLHPFTIPLHWQCLLLIDMHKNRVRKGPHRGWWWNSWDPRKGHRENTGVACQPRTKNWAHWGSCLSLRMRAVCLCCTHSHHCCDTLNLALHSLDCLGKRCLLRIYRTRSFSNTNSVVFPLQIQESKWD